MILPAHPLGETTQIVAVVARQYATAFMILRPEHKRRFAESVPREIIVKPFSISARILKT